MAKLNLHKETLLQLEARDVAAGIFPSIFPSPFPGGSRNSCSWCVETMGACDILNNTFMNEF